jgi:hypothetical protein
MAMARLTLDCQGCGRSFDELLGKLRHPRNGAEAQREKFSIMAEREVYNSFINASMLINVTGHTNDLVVALLSNDADLAHIVNSAVKMPWRLKHYFYNGEVLEFLQLADVRLVIVDDEAVSESDRGWLLGQVHRNLNEATLLYVAGNHSAENERRARSKGAHYYTAKPLQSDELTGVLKGFMNRANR